MTGARGGLTEITVGTEIDRVDADVGNHDADARNDPMDPRPCAPSESEAADGEEDAANARAVEAHFRVGRPSTALQSVLVNALLSEDVPQPADEGADEA